MKNNKKKQEKGKEEKGKEEKKKGNNASYRGDSGGSSGVII